MAQIQDGTGKSLLAKVDNENKLHTRAVAIGELAHAALNNNAAYVLYGRCNMSLQNTNEPLMYIRNDGDNDVVVSQVTLSTNANTCKVELFFDVENVTGGSTRLPLNLNRGSKRASSLYCVYNSNNLMAHDAVDSNKEFLDIRLGSGMPTFTYDFEDSLILTPGTDLFLQAETDGVSGDKVRANLYFYEITNG